MLCHATCSLLTDSITSVENYHVFHECRTFWCTDPEEHGYFLTPVSKCITDNKMQIIHRWYECDTVGNLVAPMRTSMTMTLAELDALMDLQHVSSVKARSGTTLERISVFLLPTSRLKNGMF